MSIRVKCTILSIIDIWVVMVQICELKNVQVVGKMVRYTKIQWHLNCLDSSHFNILEVGVEL